MGAGSITHHREHETDLEFQRRILDGVSRTFALTIPELPAPLAEVVANGYLLCRIADTIEDDPGLAAAEKRAHAERFIAVLEGRGCAERFARELAPRLAPSVLDSERELVYNAARVVRLAHGFGEPQRAALARCVRVMSRGMSEFQRHASLAGLRDLAELDRYCYHVAGVVGEMLTELFAHHSEGIAARRSELLPLAVSFGQGLQMTNILKDLWEDRRRGACWLPRDLFARAGLDLERLAPGATPAFRAVLDELVGVARVHLRGALEYTLRVPPGEVGIRRFCLWALGMAVLTLRRIHANPGYQRAEQVKISRTSVRATVLVGSLSAGHDRLLRALFAGATQGLPLPGDPPPVAPA